MADGCGASRRSPFQKRPMTIAAVSSMQRDPDAAIALADLVEAQQASRRRGGDPKADERTERDDTFRALARLLFADLPIERQARAVIQICKRRLASGHGPEMSVRPERNL